MAQRNATSKAKAAEKPNAQQEAQTKAQGTTKPAATQAASNDEKKAPVSNETSSADQKNAPVSNEASSNVAADPIKRPIPLIANVRVGGRTLKAGTHDLTEEEGLACYEAGVIDPDWLAENMHEAED